MKEKPERQGTLWPSSPDETDDQHAQTKDPLRRVDPGQVLTTNDRREFLTKARRYHEKDWLAPAGSEQERQILERWFKQKGLKGKDRYMVDSIMENLNGSPDRNGLFWEAAKVSVVGEYAYDTAMGRHRKLKDNEFLVAFLTTQGFEQKEIAKLLHVAETTVDNVVRRLKDKVSQDSRCAIERVDLAQITRWFLGL